MRRHIPGTILALLASTLLSGCGGNNTYNPSLIGGTVPTPSFTFAVELNSG